MSDINVGDPYRLGGVYGRVVETDGGTIYFSTPHDSVIQTGFLHFARNSKRLTDWEDLNKLFEFEQYAIKAGQKMYGGRLDRRNQNNVNA